MSSITVGRTVRLRSDHGGAFLAVEGFARLDARLAPFAAPQSSPHPHAQPRIDEQEFLIAAAAGTVPNRLYHPAAGGHDVADRVDLDLQLLARVPRAVATSLGRDGLPPTQRALVHTLEEALRGAPRILGLAVALEQEAAQRAYGADTFALYVSREPLSAPGADERFTAARMGQDDYEYLSREWYARTKQEGQSTWGAQTVDAAAANVPIMTFAAPVRAARSAAFLGVVRMDVMLDTDLAKPRARSTGDDDPAERLRAALAGERPTMDEIQREVRSKADLLAQKLQFFSDALEVRDVRTWIEADLLSHDRVFGAAVTFDSGHLVVDDNTGAALSDPVVPRPFYVRGNRDRISPVIEWEAHLGGGERGSDPSAGEWPSSGGPVWLEAARNEDGFEVVTYAVPFYTDKHLREAGGPNGGAGDPTFRRRERAGVLTVAVLLDESGYARAGGAVRCSACELDTGKAYHHNLSSLTNAVLCPRCFRDGVLRDEDSRVDYTRVESREYREFADQYRRVGHELVYGQHVQLLHVKSQRFLTVTLRGAEEMEDRAWAAAEAVAAADDRREDAAAASASTAPASGDTSSGHAADDEAAAKGAEHAVAAVAAAGGRPSFYRLAVEDVAADPYMEGGEGSWFTVKPASEARSQGDRVAAGDAIRLVSTRWRWAVEVGGGGGAAAAAATAPAAPTPTPGSGESMAASWKVMATTPTDSLVFSRFPALAAARDAQESARAAGAARRRRRRGLASDSDSSSSDDSDSDSDADGDGGAGLVAEIEAQGAGGAADRGDPLEPASFTSPFLRHGDVIRLRAATSQAVVALVQAYEPGAGESGPATLLEPAGRGACRSLLRVKPEHEAGQHALWAVEGVPGDAAAPDPAAFGEGEPVSRLPGIILWGSQVRLRHLLTGEFLALGAERNDAEAEAVAAASGSGTKVFGARTSARPGRATLLNLRRVRAPGDESPDAHMPATTGNAFYLVARRKSEPSELFLNPGVRGGATFTSYRYEDDAFHAAKVPARERVAASFGRRLTVALDRFFARVDEALAASRARLGAGARETAAADESLAQLPARLRLLSALLDRVSQFVATASNNPHTDTNLLLSHPAHQAASVRRTDICLAWRQCMLASQHAVVRMFHLMRHPVFVGLVGAVASAEDRAVPARQRAARGLALDAYRRSMKVVSLLVIDHPEAAVAASRVPGEGNLTALLDAMPASAVHRLGVQRLLALMFENGRKTDSSLSLSQHQISDMVRSWRAIVAERYRLEDRVYGTLNAARTAGRPPDEMAVRAFDAENAKHYRGARNFLRVLTSLCTFAGVADAVNQRVVADMLASAGRDSSPRREPFVRVQEGAGGIGARRQAVEDRRVGRAPSSAMVPGSPRAHAAALRPWSLKDLRAPTLKLVHTLVIGAARTGGHSLAANAELMQRALGLPDGALVFDYDDLLHMCSDDGSDLDWAQRARYTAILHDLHVRGRYSRRVINRTLLSRELVRSAAGRGRGGGEPGFSGGRGGGGGDDGGGGGGGVGGADDAGHSESDFDDDGARDELRERVSLSGDSANSGLNSPRSPHRWRPITADQAERAWMFVLNYLGQCAPTHEQNEMTHEVLRLARTLMTTAVSSRAEGGVRRRAKSAIDSGLAPAVHGHVGPRSELSRLAAYILPVLGTKPPDAATGEAGAGAASSDSAHARAARLMRSRDIKLEACRILDVLFDYRTAARVSAYLDRVAAAEWSASWEAADGEARGNAHRLNTEPADSVALVRFPTSSRTTIRAPTAAPSDDARTRCESALARVLADPMLDLVEDGSDLQLELLGVVKYWSDAELITSAFGLISRQNLAASELQHNLGKVFVVADEAELRQAEQIHRRTEDLHHLLRVELQATTAEHVDAARLARSSHKIMAALDFLVSQLDSPLAEDMDDEDDFAEEATGAEEEVDDESDSDGAAPAAVPAGSRVHVPELTSSLSVPGLPDGMRALLDSDRRGPPNVRAQELMRTLDVHKLVIRILSIPAPPGGAIRAAQALCYEFLVRFAEGNAANTKKLEGHLPLFFGQAHIGPGPTRLLTAILHRNLDLCTRITVKELETYLSHLVNPERHDSGDGGSSYSFNPSSSSSKSPHWTKTAPVVRFLKAIVSVDGRLVQRNQLMVCKSVCENAHMLGFLAHLAVPDQMQHLVTLLNKPFAGILSATDFIASPRRYVPPPAPAPPTAAGAGAARPMKLRWALEAEEEEEKEKVRKRAGGGGGGGKKRAPRGKSPGRKAAGKKKNKPKQKKAAAKASAAAVTQAGRVRGPSLVRRSSARNVGAAPVEAQLQLYYLELISLLTRCAPAKYVYVNERARREGEESALLCRAALPVGRLVELITRVDRSSSLLPLVQFLQHVYGAVPPDLMEAVLARFQRSLVAVAAAPRDATHEDVVLALEVIPSFVVTYFHSVFRAETATPPLMRQARLLFAALARVAEAAMAAEWDERAAVYRDAGDDAPLYGLAASLEGSVPDATGAVLPQGFAFDLLLNALVHVRDPHGTGRGRPAGSAMDASFSAERWAALYEALQGAARRSRRGGRLPLGGGGVVRSRSLAVMRLEQMQAEGLNRVFLERVFKATVKAEVAAFSRMFLAQVRRGGAAVRMTTLVRKTVILTGEFGREGAASSEWVQQNSSRFAMSYLNVLRKILSSSGAADDAAVDESVDDGGDDGSVNTALRSQLIELGLCRKLVDLISLSSSVKVTQGALRLANSLLEGGYAPAQASFLHYLESEGSSIFFARVRDLIGTKLQISTGLEGLRGYPTWPAKRAKRWDVARRALRMVQLLCEGHNLQWQRLLNDQERGGGSSSSRVQLTLAAAGAGAAEAGAGPLSADSGVGGASVNVVAHALSVLVRLVANRGPLWYQLVYYDAWYRADVVRVTIRTVSQLLETLTEVMQGPCGSNQVEMARGRFVESVNWLLEAVDVAMSTHPSEAGADTGAVSGRYGTWISADRLHAREYVLVRLQDQTIAALNAMLEGNVDPLVPLQLFAVMRFDLVQSMMRRYLRAASDPARVRAMARTRAAVDGEEVAARREVYESLTIRYYLFVRTLIDRFQSSKARGQVSRVFTELLLSDSYRACEQRYVDRIGSVEILRGSRVEMVFFEIPELVTQQSRTPAFRERKRAMLDEVRRDNQLSKLDDVLRSESEITYNLTANPRVQRSWLVRGFYRILDLTLLLALVLNVLTLVANDRTVSDDDAGSTDLEHDAAEAMWWVGVVHVAASALRLASVVASHAPLAWHKNKLRRREEEKEEETLNSPSRGFLKTAASAVLGGVDLIQLQVRRTWQFVWFLVAFAGGGTAVTYNLLYAAASVAGLWWPVAYSFHMFDVVYRSPTLMAVGGSLRGYVPAFGATAVLWFVMLYSFSSVGFAFFDFIGAGGGVLPEDADLGRTASKLEVLSFVLTQGLRAGGGIADVIEGVEYRDGMYWSRAIYDDLFFFLSVLLMGAIVSGYVIEAFSGSRDAASEIEADQTSKCFVCGLPVSRFEASRGFTWHISKEHNLSAYLYFFAYLKLKPSDTYTGPEQYVASHLEAGDSSFFPVGRSIMLFGPDGKADDEE